MPPEEWLQLIVAEEALAVGGGHLLEGEPPIRRAEHIINQWAEVDIRLVQRAIAVLIEWAINEGK